MKKLKKKNITAQTPPRPPPPPPPHPLSLPSQNPNFHHSNPSPCYHLPLHPLSLPLPNSHNPIPSPQGRIYVVPLLKNPKNYTLYTDTTPTAAPSPV